MPSLLDAHPDFARFLDGRLAADAASVSARADFQTFCDEQELAGLLHHRIAAADPRDWPSAWWASLCGHAHGEAASELLRADEIKSVLRELAAAGIQPILFKGTALAYSIYPSPVCRPRNDTDMLIGVDQVDAARHALIACGYVPTVYCADLFSQFEVQRVDRFGVLHVFDVHWRVSTQPVFEKLPTYDDLVSRCQAVPALGPYARAAGRVDALLLACVHPAMHHRNLERALWIYDVHLLASAISEAELDEFVLRAEAAEVGTVAAHALQRARSVFGTVVPDWVLARLAAAAAESSSAYLASERRWHHELISSLRALPLGRRMAFVRAVLFPSPQYVLGAYGFRGKRLGVWLLPALYAHRNLRGAWKVLTRKK
jgi:hypothetical protein